MSTEKPIGYVKLTDDQQRRRRHRSLAVAILLAVLAIAFYIITFIKMSPSA